MQKMNLVAADDHQLFLEGLESLFLQVPNYNLIAVCGDGDALLALIEKHKPDIALVDISMPGASTETIVKTVQKNFPNTQLLALTMHLEPALAEKLFKLGMCGYVLKEEAFDELSVAISSLESGEQYISPALITALTKYHDEIDNKKEILTHREVDVLNHAAMGSSNKEIARSLDISERTVRFHMTNCCIKLNAHGRSNAIAKAMQLELIVV